MVFRRDKGKGGEAATKDPLRQVTTEAELAETLGKGTALIYKHSFRCGLCVRSMKEVRKFAELRPDVPVAMVDVVADRELSDAIAERFDVGHESPQALVVRGGRVVWEASHSVVTAANAIRAVHGSG